MYGTARYSMEKFSNAFLQRFSDRPPPRQASFTKNITIRVKA